MGNSMEVSQELKMKLPYDPAILSLGIYLKKMKMLTQKDRCNPMFIAALFTQPRYVNNLCPLMDE